LISSTDLIVFFFCFDINRYIKNKLSHLEKKKKKQEQKQEQQNEREKKGKNSPITMQTLQI
jgi:hypothetical protein